MLERAATARERGTQTAPWRSRLAKLRHTRQPEFNMRTLIGIGLGLVFSCGVAVAAQPPDAKKLIGQWEQPGDKAKKRVKTVFDFKDGTKLTISLGEEGDIVSNYAYKVEGRQIILTSKTKDGDSTRTLTTTKLTEEVLELQEDGTKFRLTRVKVEKKKEDK